MFKNANLARIGLLSFIIFLTNFSKKDKYILPHEEKHIKIMRETASECTLFLKKNEEFPISEPCNVLLVGSGARNTQKGGLGSGDTEPRNYTTCEEGLENAGFNITSKKWLDEYPLEKEKKIGEHMKFIETMHIQNKVTQCFRMMAFPEYDYDLSLEFEQKADIAIYVLARNSGEGTDRRDIDGDVFLTKTEIKDILYLNEKYKKFMLVLNVGGVVDLSPIKDEVSNILLLSQLGIVTGDILADIILGKTNPSGKLATTWAKYEDYNTIKNFGELHSTNYEEGVYVGYRYFDSARVKPLFPFGFGLSYTNFSIDKAFFGNDKEKIIISAKVKNIGKYPGKEVVEVYVSPSQEKMDKPYQSLVGFKKTPELQPDEEIEITIEFKLSSVARYDTQRASYILDKGNYIVRVGNCSRKTKIYGYINLETEVVTEQLKNIKGTPNFDDYIPNIKKYPKDDLSNKQKISLTKEDFELKSVLYTYVSKIYETIQKLNNTELAYMCVGGFVESPEENNEKERGINGLTTRKVKSIKNYLRMADGAAGLRIARVYTDDNGKFKRLVPDPAWLNNYMYLYPLEKISLTLKKNEKEDFSQYKHVIYQHATSLPIPTAQAQSFNVDLIEKYGDIIGKEMQIFNLNILLAPAMNIHRNILCGRNFEYFSEDPLVAGKMATAIIKGVQSHKNCGTTVKHFTGNNQEKNRMNNNSKMSERALREIYLKGFQIAVEEGHPTCLMTSYNLVNGVHPSENSELLIDVVRNEWNFNGLIMTDWIRSGEQEFNSAKNPGQYVYNTLKAGVNIQMTGHKIDFDYIIQSLKDNTLKREDLLRCASKVYETIELLNK